MNLNHALGWGLIALPFLAMAVGIWLVSGWRVLVAVFGITGLICGVIALGVRLALE